MKRCLPIIVGLALLVAPAANAAPRPAPAAPLACSGLFFSEYIEGSSYNKALEIFNGTGGAVDLSGYSVELYSNGSGTASQSVTLAGTLADSDVFLQ